MFFYPLIYFAQFLTDAQRNSDGYYGYLLELAICYHYGRPLVISPANAHDIVFTDSNGKRRFMESKQNGGEFRHYCKGNSYISYAVFIDPYKTLPEQFGYVMPLDVFRTCGKALNHIRTEKKDADGSVKIALQTLYKYKDGDFHGAKAFKLSTLWEENGAIPFKEFYK